jgi:hypothetical protein
MVRPINFFAADVDLVVLTRQYYCRVFCWVRSNKKVQIYCTFYDLLMVIGLQWIKLLCFEQGFHKQWQVSFFRWACCLRLVQCRWFMQDRRKDARLYFPVIFSGWSNICSDKLFDALSLLAMSSVLRLHVFLLS